jgi:hypothetical protein
MIQEAGPLNILIAEDERLAGVGLRGPGDLPQAV